jgi:hypothetical protein
MTVRKLMDEIGQQLGVDQSGIMRAFAFADSSIKKSDRHFADKELSPPEEVVMRVFLLTLLKTELQKTPEERQQWMKDRMEKN